MNDAPLFPASRLLSNCRILVVDDAENDRMLLMDFLQQQGCRIYLAEDGQDGYRKAQLVQPDLILLDIRMPVCDGLAAARLLKANPGTRAIPLIFLTAAAAAEERVAGLLAGAVDYVAKPFNFEEVRLRLCIHLKTAPAAGRPQAQDDEQVNAASSRLNLMLFQSARRLLLERLDASPDLAALARSVGTNTRHLNAAFRQCVGATVFDFLREERMKAARRLLSESTLEIQVIARELGFSGPANFSTAFRERFGLTPSRFRQNFRTDA